MSGRNDGSRRLQGGLAQVGGILSLAFTSLCGQPAAPVNGPIPNRIDKPGAIQPVQHRCGSRMVEAGGALPDFNKTTPAAAPGRSKDHATRPVAPNTLANGADNPAGRALNRRVEVVIRTCD